MRQNDIYTYDEAVIRWDKLKIDKLTKNVVDKIESAMPFINNTDSGPCHISDNECVKNLKNGRTEVVSCIARAYCPGKSVLHKEDFKIVGYRDFLD